MKHLYFVRHGQSQANVDRIYAGQAETPLTALGRQQAVAAGEAAKTLGIDKIVCSPLSRAYDTAVAIAQAIGYPLEAIEQNAVFMERSYGSLVGKPWQFDKPIDDIEGVESMDSIMARGRQGLALLQAMPEDVILLAAHGTYYQALVAAIDPSQILVEGREPTNAEIIQLL